MTSSEPEPSPPPPSPSPPAPLPQAALVATTGLQLREPQAAAGSGRPESAGGERAKALAEVQLLDAKERKIAAQRQLIQASEDVRRARAHLLALPCYSLYPPNTPQT